MITFPHKVTNFFVQGDLHKGIFIALPSPFPFPSILGMHISFGSLSMPLYGMGESKANSDTLFADGDIVVARCHEPKMFIVPHINTFPPPPFINVFLPLLVFSSSSKCEFAAGSVRCKDGAMAVSIRQHAGVNLACNDPIPWISSVVTNSGTVWVGFTLGDFFAGLACIGFDIAKDLIEGKIFGHFFGSDRFKGLLKKGLVGLQRRFRPRPPKIKLQPFIPGGPNYNARRSVKQTAQKAADDKFKFRAQRIENYAAAMSGAPFNAKGDKTLVYDGDQPLEFIFGTLWGRTVGGDVDVSLGGKNEDEWLKDLPILGDLITGDLVTGDGGFADQFGAWLDGRSEYVESDSVQPPTPAAPQDPTTPQATDVMSGSGTATLQPQPLPDVGLSPEDLADLAN